MLNKTERDELRVILSEVEEMQGYAHECAASYDREGGHSAYERDFGDELRRLCERVRVRLEALLKREQAETEREVGDEQAVIDDDIPF